MKTLNSLADRASVMVRRLGGVMALAIWCHVLVASPSACADELESTPVVVGNDIKPKTTDSGQGGDVNTALPLPVKSSTKRQIMLHMTVATVTGLTSKDEKLNLIELVDPSVKELPDESTVIVSMRDPGAFRTFETLLKSYFTPKILAEPTLVVLAGRAAKFQSGGELPILTIKERVNGETRDRVEYKAFGVIVSVVPTIGDDGNIRLDLEAEHSRILPPSKRNEPSSPAIQSRKIQTGVKFEPGQTMILLEKPSGKNAAGEKLLITVTPELVAGLDDQVPSPIQPAKPPHSRGNTSDTAGLPKRPASSVKIIRVADLKKTLELHRGTTCFFESDERINRVAAESEGVVDIEPVTPHRLRIRATSVGTTSVSLRDEKGNVSRLEVSVVNDTRPLARKLKQLYPQLSIEIHDVNNSLLLRGDVATKEQAAQIIEIAEQYAPRVLSHLVVQSQPTKNLGAIPKLTTELNQLKRTFGPLHPLTAERNATLRELRKNEISLRSAKAAAPKAKPAQSPERARGDRPRLLNEVRLLRQDVRRLIELLESKLEKEETSMTEPSPSDSLFPAPHPASKSPGPWKMSLQEALRVALENYRVSGSSSRLSRPDLKGTGAPSATSADLTRRNAPRSSTERARNVESHYRQLWSKWRDLEAARATQHRLLENWRQAEAKSPRGAGAEKSLRLEYFQSKQSCDVLLNDVREAESTLRSTLGISASDGRRIQPTDSPPTVGSDDELDQPGQAGRAH